MLSQDEIKSLLLCMGFKPQDGCHDIYYKNCSNHNGYLLKVNFETETIDYGSQIHLGDLTTSNFEHSENFVVLECVDRLLEKGYPPQSLSLEHKWPMGRREKGKLDILVSEQNGDSFLMVECKTWGSEYQKEKRKTLNKGGQLFSYFQQDKAAQFLCLYSSRVHDGKIEYTNDIIKIESEFRELNNAKEVHEHWNKNFLDNGIFESWATPYNIETKALTRGRLKELQEEDSGRIYNQFAEILRHNVVSDKPNAFNKLFNLFLCKIVDEDRRPDEEVLFQWYESDTDEKLQKRLNDLYKKGMREYLTKEVTDYNDEQLVEKLNLVDAELRDEIQEMFTRVRLHKNNEFAFKEVFDEKSFIENAKVVREVVELLQPYQIRYGHKHQFLGDFFELLLNSSIKQEAGQYFTPVPIAKFIISCLPLKTIIDAKIDKNEAYFLPYVIDYAAGSGHFLTESLDEIQRIIENMKPEKYRPSVTTKIRSWIDSPFEWAFDYVYGIEKDYRLVKTAKVSCFLNGDGLANIIHADGLANFQNSDDYKGKLREISRDDPKDNLSFDVLVANPPYSVSAFKNTLDDGEQSFELFKRLTDDSSEIECLFIERTKQLLKPGAYAGIILPSTILSNSGIYTDARELLLKYFKIRAITEFGSNTFMATGTSTIALFLERRSNNDWRIIDRAVNLFFSNPKEQTVVGIENSFTKYVEAVYPEISLNDYITLVNGSPNEVVEANDTYQAYVEWFEQQTDVKQLKGKTSFQRLPAEEREATLSKLFFDKVLVKEKEKIVFFLLTYSQKTVLVKIGESQAEKNFIGYEFSTRRGKEGIKLYRDEAGRLTTKLYDEEIALNPNKANFYIHQSFLGDFSWTVPDELNEHVFLTNLTDMMDFSKISFEKSISLNLKNRIDYKTVWGTSQLVKLAEVAYIEKGTSITKETTIAGSVPVVAGGQEPAYYHNHANRSGNVITVSASGAYAGFVNFFSDRCALLNICDFGKFD